MAKRIETGGQSWLEGWISTIGDLVGKVTRQTRMIGDLNRDIAGLKAGFRTARELIRQNETLPPDVKELEEQLTEARGEIGRLDTDAAFGRAARGAVEALRASLDQERATNVLQQEAYVHSERGRLEAEEQAELRRQEAERERGRVDEMQRQRDMMREERDAAVEQAESTKPLRELYERGHERMLTTEQQAIESERAVWRRVEELARVHTRNEELVEENIGLRQERDSLANQVGDQATQIGQLTTALEEAQRQNAEMTDPKEVVALRAEIATLRTAADKRERTDEQNADLLGRVRALEAEARRYKDIAGSLAMQKGMKRISLGHTIISHIPGIRSVIFRAVAEDRYGEKKEQKRG